MAKDYYDLLGVPKDATPADLKKAYRKKAMEHHPDRNQGDPASEERLKEINEAYDVLKDENKRAAYDRFGTAAFDGSGGGGGGFRGGADFSGFSNIFEDVFADFMGGGQGARARANTGPQRGSDMQYTCEITLEEAFKGKETTITIPTTETCGACEGTGAEAGEAGVEKCPTCSGSGRIRAQQGFFTIERACPTCHGQGSIIRDPCKKCHGQGRVRKEKSLKIKIPAGVETGRRIRLGGEGEAGYRGGPAGDLYVLLAVRPHKLFHRDGGNLSCRVPIQMTTAALGGDIEVPTIEGGRAKVKIPAGTQSGQQFRIKGKGMSILRTESRGDLFIEVTVEVPVNLTRKQEDLLRQLHESMTGKSADRHNPQSSGFFSKVKEIWDDLRE